MGNYFTYITTTSIRTVLYIGITNDLERRMVEHFDNKGNQKTSPESMAAISSSTSKDFQMSGLRLSERKN